MASYREGEIGQLLSETPRREKGSLGPSSSHREIPPRRAVLAKPGSSADLRDWSPHISSNFWNSSARKSSSAHTASDGTAIAKAIDYSLGRWQALARFLDGPTLPIDKNGVENRIRQIALGHSNWLFAGSLRAGKRAAAVMSLIQSARLNGHDPYRYLNDVLQRLPTQPASRIAELLPHSWTSATTPSYRAPAQDELPSRLLLSRQVSTISDLRAR